MSFYNWMIFYEYSLTYYSNAFYFIYNFFYIVDRDSLMSYIFYCNFILYTLAYFNCFSFSLNTIYTYDFTDYDYNTRVFFFSTLSLKSFIVALSYRSFLS